MRSVLALAAVLGCPSFAAAQEEYDLANGLAERGWYDLAEDLYGKMMSSGATPDLRAEAQYGMARLKVHKAERAESTEEKNKLYDAAIAEVQEFLKKFPQHRRRGEALSDVGYLYQSKGKALVAAAKIDPTQLEPAEKAFAAAENLFKDLIAQLEKTKKARPSDEKDKAGLAAFEDWEQKMMYAKYNFAISLFSHAETFKDTPSKHPEMKRLLEQMVSFLGKDFMWEYEAYLLAYDACIFIGRGFQLLAETSDREKAEEYWRECFTYIGKAKSLLSDPANRKNEAVRDIASRAFLFEMKARAAYGDGKRGSAALQQFGAAAKLAEDFFRFFPGSKEDTAKAIKLEQARCYCKAGQTKKGVAILQEMAKQYKDTWVENVAMDILGEYGAEESLGLAFDAAVNLSERGAAYLYPAIQKYRKALQAIRKPEDQKFIPKCWLGIGQCYSRLDRYYEAAAALTELEKGPSAESEEGAMLKLGCLSRIHKITKDKADEKAYQEFRDKVARLYPERAGSGIIEQAAIEADRAGKFMEAAQKWEQLAKPGAKGYEGYIFSVGFSLYNEGDRLIKEALKIKVADAREKQMGQAMEIWKRAAEAFKSHLKEVDKLASKDPRVVKNAVGSIMFASKILVHPRIDRADEALEFSQDVDKRFPNADPRHVITVMRLRLDGKVKKGRAEEAEDDLKTIRALYLKEQVGHADLSNSLALLAQAFEGLAAREKDEEKRSIFETKSNNFYYEYFQLNPGTSSDPDQMLARASRLFDAAVNKAKAGREKLGEAGWEEVKKTFAMAYELYNQYLLLKERDLDKDTLSGMKTRITYCLVMGGKVDQAIQMYEDVVKDDLVEIKMGSAHESLADCYVAKGKESSGADRTTYLKKAVAKYGILAALLQKGDLNEHFWRLLHKYAETLYEVEPDDLKRFFNIYDKKGIAPEWDADKFGAKTRLEELRKKLQGVLPGNK